MTQGRAGAKLTPGAALRAKLGLVPKVASLDQLVDADTQAQVDIDALLPEFLFRTYCVARASVPLMEAARIRALVLAPHDPVAVRLPAYLEQHIREEAPHADWVLEDLAAIGHGRERVAARLPPAVLARMVGAQYYWVHHVHPVVLLGYIAALEQRVAPLPVVRTLAARSRHPAAAFRTLLEHASEDVAHIEALYDLLDRLPLTPAQQTALGVNAFGTLELVDASFGEMLD
jgi:hypothetical protein